MNKIFTHICDKTAKILGKPYIFITNLVIVLICTELCFQYPNGTFMLCFNTGLSIFSYLMLFIIQNSQNRDGFALQMKLDELLRQNTNENSNKLIEIEKLTIEEIELLRYKLEEEDKKK